MAVVFIEHPSSLAHETGPHPEQPARITAITAELERRGWLGLTRLRSEPVPRAALEAVHPPHYIDGLERLCESGGGPIDADTVTSAGSFEAALHAAGGATALVDLLCSGEARTGFSAHRPPGHHATQERAMGFCLFNNIAVAAQHALDHAGLERVLILDWDVHHGNGTNDIFHASDRVLFLSIHQSPLWPGSGSSHDVGEGAGMGYTVNLPVAPGSGDPVFTSLVEHVVVPLAHHFQPQLLLVSAGYDAHIADPLADCTVTEQGYAAMTGSMRRLSEELAVPLGFLLEGGYALSALASSVATTLEVLCAPAVESAVDTGMSPLAHKARQRLSEWWPELGV